MTVILGIETSCDDSCAAVVRDGHVVLSNVVSSQEELHRKFSGVVPEIASRAHLERILPVIEEALEKAGMSFSHIDAVAIANRPGLIGGLLVGLTTAKTLSAWLDIPLIGVNHIAAHIYAGMMVDLEWQAPAIALTASGGHTLLCMVESPLCYRVLGGAIDDASGEAFDKGANLLGLSGQGGAALDRLAAKGNPKAFHFPRPLRDEGYDFSFAGLKTALLYEIHGVGENKTMDALSAMNDHKLADLAASYQEAICDVLVAKASRAVDEYDARTLFVTGGVAANSRLRAKMAERMCNLGVRTKFPPMSLCTDNAAMIAGLAYHHHLAGEIASLDLEAFARSQEQERNRD